MQQIKHTLEPWYLAYGRVSDTHPGTKVQGSECATLYAASLLLADRYANGEAFIGEYIVAPSDVAAASDLLDALRDIIAAPRRAGKSQCV
jgi:hypothetical protein